MVSPKRIDIVPLVPPRAPCFPDQQTWATYIEAAQAAPVRLHSVDHAPAHRVKGEVRLYEDWDMCQDCRRRRAERARMAAEGTCKPDWWKAQAIATNVDLDLEAEQAAKAAQGAQDARQA